jgi:hypothetical protein
MDFGLVQSSDKEIMEQFKVDKVGQGAGTGQWLLRNISTRCSWLIAVYVALRHSKMVCHPETKQPHGWPLGVFVSGVMLAVHALMGLSGLCVSRCPRCGCSLRTRATGSR